MRRSFVRPDDSSRIRAHKRDPRKPGCIARAAALRSTRRRTVLRVAEASDLLAKELEAKYSGRGTTNAIRRAVARFYAEL